MYVCAVHYFKVCFVASVSICMYMYLCVTAHVGYVIIVLEFAEGDDQE